MMELLAPAGNYQQAVSCIEAGADALYGGLFKWNARNRAENFTLEQYKSVLTLCHQRTVRFYLTLNTLLRNDELRDIQALFESEDFALPDAVIAADIGLVLYLRKRFPALPIHISTQGGAVNSDDLQFWTDMGATRVILARELTLSEIKRLKNQTKLDIEIFAFGSQCVSFSGQCLWGGVLHGSSGNRGRCIGMCRDTYTCHGITGDLMYPQDINAVDMLKEISESGVCSIKIEGRLRPAEETKRIVSQFRNALDSLKEKDGVSFGKNYHGYLDSVLPVKNMLNRENPRKAARKHIPPKAHDMNVSIKSALPVFSTDGKDIVFETDRLDDIFSSANSGATFIYVIKKLSDLDALLAAEASGRTRNARIFYKLPILDFSGAIGSVLEKLKGRNVVITKISQLHTAKARDFREIWADYTMNAWNDTALRFLAENNVTAIAIHPELSFDYYLKLNHHEMKIQAIGSKKIALGYTRSCFGELGLCNSRCGSTRFSIKNDTRNYDLDILCDNDFGYRTIQTASLCEPTKSFPNSLQWIVSKSDGGIKNTVIPIYDDTVA